MVSIVTDHCGQEPSARRSSFTFIGSLRVMSCATRSSRLEIDSGGADLQQHIQAHAHTVLCKGRNSTLDFVTGRGCMPTERQAERLGCGRQGGRHGREFFLRPFTIARGSTSHHICHALAVGALLCAAQSGDDVRLDPRLSSTGFCI